MLVPFGKYKNKDYTLLIGDKLYYEWCKSNSSLLSKYSTFFNFLENPIEEIVVKQTESTAHTLKLGAIDKATNSYVLPCNADKKNKYICPDCTKDLIFKKGLIKAPHFAHYSEKEPCNYYNHPSESQIHKDAKMALKSLLDNQKRIVIKHNCCGLEFPIEYTENDKIKLEYRFDFNDSKRVADVAFLNIGTIKYIFEICNTHKTSSENRPEPWFELDAREVITTANTDTNPFIFQCIRGEYMCQSCLEYNQNVHRQQEIESRCINYDKCKNTKYLHYNECSSCYRSIKESLNDINSHYCNARSFSEKYHIEGGQLKIMCNQDSFGRVELDNYYFGGRCKFDKIHGTTFCYSHSTTQTYGIWNGKYNGKLKTLIDEKIQSFITHIESSTTLESLEALKKQLYKYRGFTFYDEIIDKIDIKKKLLENNIVERSFILIIDLSSTLDSLKKIKQKLSDYQDFTFYYELDDKIDTKISLFKSEITKYEEILRLTNINNSNELKVLLDEMSDKKHLSDIKTSIINKIRDITNKNKIKLNEFDDKIDKQKGRLDKLYALKEQINTYIDTIDTDNSELDKIINKLRCKISFIIDRFETNFIIIKEETYMLDSNNNIYDVNNNKFLGKYFNNQLLLVNSA